MTELPFTISPEALEWIAERVHWGEREKPLVPVLSHPLDYSALDEKGRILEYYPHAHFTIWLTTKERVIARALVRLELAGLTLFAYPQDIEELHGKRLVLETVEAGYPEPSSARLEVLIPIDVKNDPAP